MRVHAVSVLLITFGLAGCMGGDDGPDETTDPTDTMTTTTTPDNDSFGVNVRILNHTATAGVNRPINVSWEVASPDGVESFELQHTAVHWANFSVEHPTSPADYGNTSGEQLGVNAGTFNASFDVERTDTLYLRAHAIVNGENHWSDEVTIVVEEAGAAGEVFMVSIVGAGATAGMDPDPITISVGDGIKWVNEDTLGAAHTATSDEDAPDSFDTGSIAAGEESDVVTFTTAGTYTYHCSIHSSTMTGFEIVVE